MSFNYFYVNFAWFLNIQTLGDAWPCFRYHDFTWFSNNTSNLKSVMQFRYHVILHGSQTPKTWYLVSGYPSLFGCEINCIHLYGARWLISHFCILFLNAVIFSGFFFLFLCNFPCFHEQGRHCNVSGCIEVCVESIFILFVTLAIRIRTFK